MVRKSKVGSINPVGLGCWSIGGTLTDTTGANNGWGKITPSEVNRALEAALDLGINYFQTSDVYGAGDSERFIGSVLSHSGKREKVVISTMFGIAFSEEQRMIQGLQLDRNYIRSACEASLIRLQTDRIDIYQIHPGDVANDVFDEIVFELEELAKAGKIRSIGWSTDKVERAKMIAGHRLCSAIQFQHNMLSPCDPLMLELCEQNQLLGIARSPLANGALTEKYLKANNSIVLDDFRGVNGVSWSMYFKEGTIKEDVYQKLKALNEQILSWGYKSLEQAAIRWVIDSSNILVPVVGFKNYEQVRSNALSVKERPFTREDILVTADLVNDHKAGEGYI